jgi:hypothetical protein
MPTLMVGVIIGFLLGHYIPAANQNKKIPEYFLKTGLNEIKSAVIYDINCFNNKVNNNEYNTKEDCFVDYFLSMVKVLVLIEKSKKSITSYDFSILEEKHKIYKKYVNETINKYRGNIK